MAEVQITAKTGGDLKVLFICEGFIQNYEPPAN